MGRWLGWPPQKRSSGRDLECQGWKPLQVLDLCSVSWCTLGWVLQTLDAALEQIRCPLSSMCAATWVRSRRFLEVYLGMVYRLLGNSTRMLIYDISHSRHSENVGRWWGGTYKTKGLCKSVNIHNRPHTPRRCWGRRFINSFMLINWLFDGTLC